MSVDATATSPVTVTPTSVRYALTLNASVNRPIIVGTLILQRSQKNPDDTWIDDPSSSAKKVVPLPSSVEAQPLIDLLVSVWPEITGWKSLSVRVASRLDRAGHLDVSADVIALSALDQWLHRSIPSLTAYVMAHLDQQVAIGTVWANLDTQINAANQAERWV